uniref:Uncharacterized protein n=1 Tax=Octopus bimaculoides TaxID=37653 RepID=A0A0L8HFU2_OCTBM
MDGQTDRQGIGNSLSMGRFTTAITVTITTIISATDISITNRQKALWQIPISRQSSSALSEKPRHTQVLPPPEKEREVERKRRGENKGIRGRWKGGKGSVDKRGGGRERGRERGRRGRERKRDRERETDRQTETEIERERQRQS